MTDHIEILRLHNEWRRGAEIPTADPAVIGVAIEATIAEIERLRAGIERCYLMLLTTSDTQGALFKAEDILRELAGEE